MNTIFFAHGETTIFPGILILLALHVAAIYTVIAAFMGKKNIALILCAVTVTIVGGFEVFQVINEIGVVYAEDVMSVLRALSISGALLVLGVISLVRLLLGRAGVKESRGTDDNRSTGN
jgi:hypothetical protein